jgi:hypothetical protein
MSMQSADIFCLKSDGVGGGFWTVHKLICGLSSIHRYRAERLMRHLGTHNSGVELPTEPAQVAFRGHRRLTGWQRLSYGVPVRNQQPGSLAEEFRAWSRFVARGDLWIVGTNRLHEFDGGGHRKPDIQRSDLTRDRRLIEASWQRFGLRRLSW